jgi:Leucine-rich repeat (LRR) protein
MKKLIVTMTAAFLFLGYGLSENEALEKVRKAKRNGTAELNLNYSSISDLAPLARLTDLQRLFLFENQVSDITRFAKLVNLPDLSIIAETAENEKTRKENI